MTVVTAGPRMSVRAAVSGDAEAIAGIQVAGMGEVLGACGVREEAALPDEGLVAAQWRETLSRPAPAGCHTFVAVHGATVVGVVACAPVPRVPAEGRRPEVAAGVEILALEVGAAFRRSGHGSRMMRALVDAVVLQGARSLRLWVGVEDEARIRFVEANGCAPLGMARTLDVAGVGRREHLWWAALGVE